MGKNNSPNITDSIEYFNGNANIVEYLRHFESKIKIVKYSEVQAYKLLASKLTGLALDRFILEQEKIISYEQLKAFLLKTYNRKRKKIAVYSSLFSQQQYDDESIESFYLRLTFQLNDANIPEFNSHSENGKVYLMGYILQNMKASLKRRVPSDFDPQDLDEMIAELRELENYNASFANTSVNNTLSQEHMNQSVEQTFYTPHQNTQNVAKPRVNFVESTPNTNSFKARQQRLDPRPRFTPYNQTVANRSGRYDSRYQANDMHQNSKNLKSPRMILPP